jgi:hypothetical protein
MPSYVKFRDFAAVLSAGNGLMAAGGDLFSTVRSIAGTGGLLTQGELHALAGQDDYANDFRSGVYTYQGRNTVLRDNAMNTGSHANQIGQAVVKAVREMLWVDAVNGAAMMGHGGSAKAT